MNRPGGTGISGSGHGRGMVRNSQADRPDKKIRASHYKRITRTDVLGDLSRSFSLHLLYSCPGNMATSFFAKSSAVRPWAR